MDADAAAVEDRDPQLLEVDSRGRIALGSLREDRRRFLAHRNADGSILLEPAVVLSEAEARLLADPALHAQIVAAAGDGEAATRGRG